MATEPFSFSRDFFSLFDLTPGVDVDEARLRSNFMALQRQYHPDRYAAGSAVERRLALQITSHVNEAHQVLANPLKRAEYCLKLRGVNIDTETDTSMPADFLMEQLELREQLGDIESSKDSWAALDQLRDELHNRQLQLRAETGELLQADDLTGARGSVRKWQFMDKLDREAQAMEAKFDDQL